MVLRKRTSRFRKCLLRASARAGEKEIHDLRVSIRRLLAGLSVASSLLGKAEHAGDVRKRLKSLMTPLGRLRDAQVKMLWLTREVPEADEPSFLFALSVANDLEKWGTRVQDFMHDTDPARFDFVPGRKDFPDIPPNELRKVAASLLRDRRRGVSALRMKAARESDPESLHRMRLAFKSYRYAAEIFAPLFPRATAESLERLHAFQTLLGDLHDFDTILEDARRFFDVVLRLEGDHAVLSRFRELRRREFRKLAPILSAPDGLASTVFGDEFET